MNLKSYRVIAGVLLLPFLVAAAHAQIASGSINGTVRESTGAVIPQATVELRNMQTGVVRTVETNGVGIYVFPDVLPGTYAITVKKSGFSSEERRSIPVTVALATSFDFTLKPATVNATVVVTSGATTLDTQTSGLSTEISETQVVDTPTNGRNFTALLITVPGASPINEGQSSGGWSTQPVGKFTYPAFSGQENYSTLFFIDGVNNYSGRYAGDNVDPIIDDISQIDVLHHTDNAASGQVLGATVNVATKGGTNDLHGAVWEFLRNDALDSKGPHVITPKTPLHQNQFGFDAGGPLVLPFYNGRKRTFLFASLEEYRLHTANLAYYLVPTPEQYNGDFSALLHQAVPVQLYNPFSTRPDPNNPGKYLRDPIPNNQIQPYLDQKAVALAQKLFPAPAQTPFAPNVANGVDTSPNIRDQALYTLRVDENIGSSDSAFVRFTKKRQHNSTTTGLSGGRIQQNPYGYNAGLGYQHIFGSRGLLHALIGRNYMNQAVLAHDSRVDSASMPQYFDPAFACGYDVGYGSDKCGLPAFGIPDYPTSATTDENSVFGVSNTWQYSGDVSWVFGAHQLKGGISFATAGVTDFANGGAVFNYSAIQTANLEAQAGTGYALASFFMGLPNQAVRTGSRTTSLPGTWNDGGYVQDTWKINDHLTANIGLRYDVGIFGYTRTNGQVDATGNFNMTTGNYTLQRNPGLCSTVGKAPCIPGTALPAHVDVSTQSNGRIWQTQYGNIQPRLGVIYQINRKLVAHAGYGKLVDIWSNIIQHEQNIAAQWPSTTSSGSTPNQITPDTLAENYKPPVSLPGPNPYGQLSWYTDPKGKTPYSDQWNVGIQQQVASDTVVTIDYVGAHDGHLALGDVTNVGRTPGSLGSDRPYPYFVPTFYTQFTGSSSYNALELTVNHRISNGLNFLVSYTWSKEMNVGADGDFFAGYGIRDPYHPELDRGRAGDNVPQNLSISGVYRPDFKLANRVVNQIVTGWSLGSIISAYSGKPFTVTLGVDNAEIGTSQPEDRPNVVGNPKLDHPIHHPDGSVTWFKTSAFVAPPPLSHGDEGRNILSADPYTNIDLSLARDFPIWTENRKLQFRIDAFNVGNFYRYGVPTTVYSSPNFGVARPSGNRILQGSAKILF